MTKKNQKLKWVIVYLGKDLNWWVESISDNAFWSPDEDLGIIDSRQIAYLLDLFYSLNDYSFETEQLAEVFFKFTITAKAPCRKGHIRLSRYYEPYQDADKALFWLPDTSDGEKSPYSDFVEHITHLQVQRLNDIHPLKQPLTIEDLEGDVQEKQEDDLIEGRPTHCFNELRYILEYSPKGHTPVLEDAEEIDKEMEADDGVKIISEAEEARLEDVIASEEYEPIKEER